MVSQSSQSPNSEIPIGISACSTDLQQSGSKGQCSLTALRPMLISLASVNETIPLFFAIVHNIFLWLNLLGLTYGVFHFQVFTNIFKLWKSVQSEFIHFTNCFYLSGTLNKHTYLLFFGFVVFPQNKGIFEQTHWYKRSTHDFWS